MKNKQSRFVTAHNAFELAQVLGLSAEDAIAFEFRAKLNKKIVDLVHKQKLTHQDIAKKAKASRTRITAILNGKTDGVSTDFLLRLLYALNCKTSPIFSEVKMK